MKYKELQKLSEQELREKLKDMRKDLAKQNAQVAMHTQIKNPGHVKNLKKTIARILTSLTQRGLKEE